MYPRCLAILEGVPVLSFRHKAVQSIIRDTRLSSISFQERVMLHRKCKGKISAESLGKVN